MECRWSTCHNKLPKGHPFKSCPRCLAYKKKYRASAKGKAKQKKYESSTARKIVRTRYLKTEKGAKKHAASKKKYVASEHGKKAIQKRNAYHNGKLINRIGTKVRISLNAGGHFSSKISDFTDFADEDDLSMHLEFTFEKWMSWDNHGVHEAGAPYNTKWHIGHRIPRDAFDDSNLEDVRKCWNRRNIFAQCARENVENGPKMPSKEELEELKDLWPAKWVRV